MATYVDLTCRKCGGELILEETAVPASINWRRENKSENVYVDVYRCNKCGLKMGIIRDFVINA